MAHQLLIPHWLMFDSRRSVSPDVFPLGLIALAINYRLSTIDYKLY